MKFLSILLLVLLLSSCSKQKMICHVVSIDGLSEEHQKDFGMQNGPVKRTVNDYSISISFNEDELDFKNLSNEATMTMNRVAPNKEENISIYENTEQGWYSFALKNNNKDFLFSVGKANYEADYHGICEVVE